MNSQEILTKYFPDITEEQRSQLLKLEEVYALWNSRINVVSRKDFEEFFSHHVLHSLSIAKFCTFDDGCEIADVGCGGGFPSVPLAIMFPNVHFTAIDSIAKKIRVVEEVCKAVGIKNITTRNCRVEDCKQHFDYVVSRAVTEMATFVGWVWPHIRKGQHGSVPNGIIYLKGGDLAEELAKTRMKWNVFSISSIYDEEFFETKKIVQCIR